MVQLILHLIGDYLTQSHWMAQGKTRSSAIAAIHATLYALPFLAIGSAAAVLLIGVSHFFVDRFRLARYLVWLKNLMLSPPIDPQYLTADGWPLVTDTGYPSTVPPWMAVWLLIIADNTIHLAGNYLLLKFA